MPLIFAIFEWSRDHTISAYKIWEMDNSVANELIGVPNISGSRTALVGNDMSQGGLYDTTAPEINI